MISNQCMQQLNVCNKCISVQKETVLLHINLKQSHLSKLPITLTSYTYFNASNSYLRNNKQPIIQK